MSAQTHDLNEEEDDNTQESSIIQLYKAPSWIGLLRSASINIALPFLNGVFLGFGEIFAHEVAFLFGWRGASLRPASRSGLSTGHMVGPGIGVERRADTRSSRELEDITSME